MWVNRLAFAKAKPHIGNLLRMDVVTYSKKSLINNLLGNLAECRFFSLYVMARIVKVTDMN